MNKSIYSFVQDWVAKVSLPRTELQGQSLCPFAKKAKWDFYLLNKFSLDISLCKKEVTIFALLGTISKMKLEKYVKQLKAQHPKYVFLPDHKNANTKIKGIATGNGKYNLILVQKRRKLTSARKYLTKKKYYENVSKSYKNKLFSY